MKTNPHSLTSLKSQKMAVDARVTHKSLAEFCFRTSWRHSDRICKLKCHKHTKKTRLKKLIELDWKIEILKRLNLNDCSAWTILDLARDSFRFLYWFVIIGSNFVTLVWKLCKSWKVRESDSMLPKIIRT